jgi:hypothetical protein
MPIWRYRLSFLDIVLGSSKTDSRPNIWLLLAVHRISSSRRGRNHCWHRRQSASRFKLSDSEQHINCISIYRTFRFVTSLDNFIFVFTSFSGDAELRRRERRAHAATPIQRILKDLYRFPRLIKWRLGPRFTGSEAIYLTFREMELFIQFLAQFNSSSSKKVPARHRHCLDKSVLSNVWPAI